MSTNLKAVISIIFITIAFKGHADLSIVNNTFEKDFYQHYESGKCGQNIMNFIRRHADVVKDWSDAYIIQVKNQGFSLFGLINVEQARQKGRYISENNWEAGNANFHHHVFLDYKGQIVDFDFTNSPSILSKAEYLESMFLNDVTKPIIGRSVKLKDYVVEITTVNDFLDNRESTEKLSLEQYLNLF